MSISFNQSISDFRSIYLRLYTSKAKFSSSLLFSLFIYLASGSNLNMSLIGVRSAPFLLSDYCSSIRSISSSLSDVASSYDLSSDILNLEDLKAQLGQSCLSCGVCWTDDHFSFDCAECGGYSIKKPCPKCNGSCGSIWTRDFSMVNIYFSVLFFIAYSKG